MITCPICGKSKSKGGTYFTIETFIQHIDSAHNPNKGIICPFCNKQESAARRQFTKISLQQHIRDVHGYSGYEEGDPTFELTDMIATEDMPDGAYFAIAHELGEW